jgi:hypothetical protein
MKTTTLGPPRPSCAKCGGRLNPGEVERHAHCAKRKPGRPISTGSADTPMVQFRVSRDERKAITARAKAARETVNQYAKRRTLGEV